MFNCSLFDYRYGPRLLVLVKSFMIYNYLADLFSYSLRFCIFLAFSVLFMLLFGDGSHE